MEAGFSQIQSHKNFVANSYSTQLHTICEQVHLLIVYTVTCSASITVLRMTKSQQCICGFIVIPTKRPR